MQNVGAQRSLLQRARTPVQVVLLPNGVQRTARPTLFVVVQDCYDTQDMNLSVRKNFPQNSYNSWLTAVGLSLRSLRPAGKTNCAGAYTGDAVLAAIKFNHKRCVWHCGLCLL